MCGIVGYIGKQEAAPILLEGLKALEYRGYDSAGIAVFSKKREILALKAVGKVASLEEKPKKPRSNWVVSGLYFFDNQVVALSKKLKPSIRGELEVTDLLKEYLKKGLLKVELLSRGYAWLDTGTYDSLIDASMFIKTIEERQGLKIGCLEEIAYRMGYINRRQLEGLAREINTNYGEYLKRIIKELQYER